MQIATAGLLIIQDRKLLLAYSKNKQCFYLPGGKIDTNETAEEALFREIREELDVRLDRQKLQFYTHITAPAYGELNGTVMEQDCFLYHRAIEPVAAAEIGALKYFTLEEYLEEPVNAPGAVKVLQLLQADNLVD